MAILRGKLTAELLKEKGIKVSVTRGKVIISSKPQHYTVSNSPEAIRCRNNFAFKVHFTKNLLSIPLLNEIWKTRSSQGIKNTFNYICKTNIGLDHDGIPSDENVLIPAGEFSLPSVQPFLFTGCIKIKINPLSRVLNIHRKMGVRYAAAGLLCHYDSYRRMKYPYAFTIIDLEPQDFNLKESMNLVRELKTDERKTLSKFRKSKLYLAVVILDTKGNVLKYSSTSSIDFQK